MKKKIKHTLFLTFCIIISIIVALLMPYIERDQKTIQCEETVPTVDPDPSPVVSPASDSGSATAEAHINETQAAEGVFPHQMHYISGWDKCLDVLHVDCDVAFLGDSITYKSFFDVYFRDYSICNLGVAGDTIEGLSYRVGTLEAVKPEIVFVMIGINSLRNDTVDKCAEDYRTLVEKIKSLGDFDLYLMSITPLSENELGEDNPSPETIISFNKTINDIAAENDAGYLDLFALLQDSGYIRPEYTTDGIHLSEKAYGVWADFIRPYIVGY